MYGNGRKDNEEAHLPVTLSNLIFISVNDVFLENYDPDGSLCADVASPISSLLPDVQLWSTSMLETSDCQSAVHDADFISAYSLSLELFCFMSLLFGNLENYILLWSICFHVLLVTSQSRLILFEFQRMTPPALLDLSALCSPSSTILDRSTSITQNQPINQTRPLTSSSPRTHSTPFHVLDISLCHYLLHCYLSSTDPQRLLLLLRLPYFILKLMNSFNHVNRSLISLLYLTFLLLFSPPPLPISGSLMSARHTFLRM